MVHSLPLSLSSPILLPKGRLVEGAECFVSVMGFLIYFAHCAYCPIFPLDKAVGGHGEEGGGGPLLPGDSASHSVSSLADDFILATGSAATAGAALRGMASIPGRSGQGWFYKYLECQRCFP